MEFFDVTSTAHSGPKKMGSDGVGIHKQTTEC